MPGRDLQGLHVLVTRPREQADKLSAGIRQLGGTPVLLPVLDIVPLTPTASTKQPALSLANIDLLIFISANAVAYGLPYLTPLPAHVQIGAIGQATAECLRNAGLEVALVPASFDSEGFLALSQVQDLHNKSVLIVRGEGGREKLAQSLRERGAQVDYLEVYRRACPHWGNADVSTAIRADIIIITSSEALENLAKLAHMPGAAELWSKPLLVFHARIASRARELGFTLTPVVAEQPSDDALLSALMHWQN